MVFLLLDQYSASTGNGRYDKIIKVRLSDCNDFQKIRDENGYCLQRMIHLHVIYYSTNF